MKQRATFFPIFFIFLVLSLIIFFFAQKGAFLGFTGFFEQMTVPMQKMTFGLLNNNGGHSELDKLRAENSRLLTELAKQKELEKENRALHDQFEATKITPTKLLPATVIGLRDDMMTIDKGTSDGVTLGKIIVYKDSLVGKVVKESTHLSVVHLLTNSDTAFTAQTTKTETLGVVKGKGSNTLFFENVVLADKLEKNDLVVTKGNIETDGKGYPPDLIVGKIVSVNKKASSLFQTAELQSLVDFEKLNIVFIFDQ